MAQPIHCDVHDRAHPADVLVSRLDDGQTLAACNAGYVELCQAIAAQAAEALTAAAAELAAQAELEADQEGLAADTDALARLAELQGSGLPHVDPTAGDFILEHDAQGQQLVTPLAPSQDVADHQEPGDLSELQPGPEPDTAPAVVIPRGSSSSRKRHEARQRAQAAQVAADTAQEPDGPPGQPSEPTADPDGVPASP